VKKTVKVAVLSIDGKATKGLLGTRTLSELLQFLLQLASGHGGTGKFFGAGEW